ncbi:dihydrofolate reductase [Drosophila guanche]|uniref:dihydrofolate reductase n=1 Tax=Drosophila guanche TaxID=7266 RepID=A0A3B0JRJ1_DROGU|nr:dihydrofolate reductase [Drosophila guanche]SPP83623.1 blast:Dihydrofolate reductase [Drosophila guanche]
MTGEKMLRFNLIVAVCENFGIGLKGDLPWSIKSELKYFSRTTKRTSDPCKSNAVIMGRRTYFGVPASKRPLPERLNIVLSTTLQPADLPSDVVLCSNLEEAMKHLETKALRDEIENVWIVGGSGVYKEAMASPRCDRLYITKIQQNFECDTFFPSIPDSFREVSPDADTPLGVQEENGIKYEYKVLKKIE